MISFQVKLSQMARLLFPFAIMDLNIDNIAAFILDMDGVVTDTAGLHALAWKRMFDEFLAHRTEQEGGSPQSFDPDKDYLDYVDGKPRYDGVKSFLSSRGIHLPFGDPADPPDRETVCGLGNRKNSYFLEILEKEEVSPYPSTVDFIKKGLDAGIRCALISASRNARKVLKAAKLENLFEVVIDGRTAEEMGLAGKPAPDIFLAAAEKLGVDPDRSVVVEDSQAGVQAGKTGDFAMVIGIERKHRDDRLKRAGADLVVGDLAEVFFAASRTDDKELRLPSALDEEDAIFKLLRQGTLAVFLDYDGTLTPIVRDPSEARLDHRTRQALQKLAEHLFVAVISGRGLADVRNSVGLENLVYAGSHGFEVSGSKGYFEEEAEKNTYLAALEKAEQELNPFAADLAGVTIERKPFAIAVHYRQAAEDTVPALREKVDGIARRFAELKKTTGKKIFELRPDVDWDKGKALQSMLAQFFTDCSRVTPLYIGDDTTDEDAFRSIADNGISILVSDRPPRTAARYVLRDPSEVTIFLERLAGMADRINADGIWSMTYHDFEEEQEKLREALCTLGNGYFASRGAAPESKAGPVHYPGSYISGCYNRRKSTIAGRIIENESLVNIPNWLPLSFRLEDGDWFDLRQHTPLDYSQELDLAAGILTRTVRFIDEQQREIHFVQRRFISMNDPHLAGLETEITVKNWAGTIHVCSALDGRVANSLVARYRELDNNHLDMLTEGSDDGEILWLQAETNQSHIRIATACRTRFFLAGTPVEPPRLPAREKGYIGQEAALKISSGQSLRIEKIAAVYTSRDRAITESMDEARRDAALAPDFSTLLADHRRTWQHLWKRCRIKIQATNGLISRILNLHIFHLLQTVSLHSIDLDVGVPPRGLHGEAYRGLIMWDELFIFPFLNLRIPDLTRALLLYRYRRLPRAQWAAKEAGYQGAMFPWQSGSNGREEAQTLHLNPQSGRWVPDNTRLQRHINLAVAYNIWEYYQVSGDIDFLSFYGAEMSIEIARFCASMAVYNESLDRYEIRGVVGPDEFHTRYPDASEPGLDNNAYTNIMAVWVLCRTLDILKLVPEERRQPLWENLALKEEELQRWDEISRKMRIVFHEDGIISQFEGYDRLQEFDWEHYNKKYGDIHRLDRILEKEGDSADRYKLSKQADVLMLFYLFSADELSQLFERLGYPFAYETIPKNIEYYLKRTSHGSTLSRVVHAWVLARSKRRQSWHLFCDALKSDVNDIQGGTTHEGIHLGAMAGTVDLIQRCYSGLETRENALWFNPALPEEIKELDFNILYRHHWLQVTIRQDSLKIRSRGNPPGPIKVGLLETARELQPGETITLEMKG
ncbi:MAG: trehalose-phosphatase [Desulfobulbaceae bacterium]|nr:trehalose-phosphatase [Desulfobulbaceae bacterium]